MSCCSCELIWGTILLLIIAYIGIKIVNIFKTPPLPLMDKNKYWGGKNHELMRFNMHIRPFKVEFTPEAINDLKQRLNTTRFTEPFEDVGFEYGFNHNGLKPLVEYWGTKYDFAERENFLNQYPHFKVMIQGLDIHFIHVKPKVPENIRVLPLLMLHGWPGSIVEFYKVIPLLTTPSDGYDFVFELVIPSLPGFGFSQAPAKSGLGAIQIAAVMSNLMARLEIYSYYIQGGDWGSIIGSHLITLYPDEVLGYHTNMSYLSTPLSHLKTIIGSFCPMFFIQKKYRDRVYPLFKKMMFYLQETGYFHIQATKPETIGIGLDNSPAGLAAWILEKFAPSYLHRNIDLPDGGLTEMFNYDELIDNLMIYWVNKAATTSGRIYAESVCKAQMAMGLEKIPTKVPTAVARFPYEIVHYTSFQLREKYPNLVQVSDFITGGHFAAFEQPELLAADIKKAVVKFEDFHKKKNNKKH